MEPLIRSIPAFQILEEPVLFNQVRVDAGGYGVTWNDNLDLSCNELWEREKLCNRFFLFLYIIEGDSETDRLFLWEKP